MSRRSTSPTSSDADSPGGAPLGGDHNQSDEEEGGAPLRKKNQANTTERSANDRETSYLGQPGSDTAVTGPNLGPAKSKQSQSTRDLDFSESEDRLRAQLEVTLERCALAKYQSNEGDNEQESSDGGDTM